MREFVSGPPRYRLAIKGVRELFVILDQDRVSFVYLRVFTTENEIAFFNVYSLDPELVHTVKGWARLVTSTVVYRLLRIKLTCTCYVCRVSNAHGHLRQHYHFKEVQHKERSEHSAIRPVFPFPVPTPPSHNTWNHPSCEDFCSAKKTFFCIAKTSILIFFGF